jgi:hypothetical protein
MKPDYTVRDLFSYGGFICGIATFMMSTTGWQVHHFLRLGSGVVVGLIVGFIATATYDRLKSPPQPRDQFRGPRHPEATPEERDEFGPKW